jgi:adenine-specific DNA glycosylase
MQTDKSSLRGAPGLVFGVRPELVVKQAVVDANVARIIRRVFHQSLPKVSQSGLQSGADSLLPHETHRAHNFGLLDLGALVCRYTRPTCCDCPFEPICEYASYGGQQDGEPRKLSALRQIRTSQGMTLAELAKKAGASKLTVINIEAKRTSPREGTIEKLSVALRVPADSID